MSKNLLARENGLSLHTINDALDILSSGLPGCILTEADLSPEFFVLSNGLAGDIFQKFINYHFKVAFVLPTDHAHGERVTELVREHANHPRIRFMPTVEDAEKWLLPAG